MILNFKLTAQMKTYLRQQILMSNSEMKQHLETRRQKLLQSITTHKKKIKHIEVELASIQ